MEETRRRLSSTGLSQVNHPSESGFPLRLKSLSVVTVDNQYKLSSSGTDPMSRNTSALDLINEYERRQTEASSSSSSSSALEGGGPAVASSDASTFSPVKAADIERRQSLAQIKDVSFTSSDPLLYRPEKKNLHLHSADLYEEVSPVQAMRRTWKPTIPDCFQETWVTLDKEKKSGLNNSHLESLAEVLPRICRAPYVEICSADVEQPTLSSPIRIGLVLSGGPAPGGHNVISGVYDFLKSRHLESQLFGFMGGLDGLFQLKYKVVTDEVMDRFRNQGGFDMLWSGRGKVKDDADRKLAREVCEHLGLRGLIVVGGDGSNSNAALLAEYFAEALPTCSVVGIPKTIDGDLKNETIEISFGFDTAAKTYSELIGNLCIDCSSGRNTYHVVRLMGRSASHLVVECAFQTRPNLILIGEEVEANSTSLREIINSIVDLITERKRRDKNYGVILVPEGLIEFIPEMKILISELNKVVQEGPFDESKLQQSRDVWNFLPESIQEQLLLDREATGYIQVAKIATERLVILLVENELSQRGLEDSVGLMPHYFGYEGRCAMPSNFDANYCYSLGLTAGCLIEKECNGYMAVVRHLDQDASMWQPCGVPFTEMMCLKKLGDGNEFLPAINRALVDLDGPLFKVLNEVRPIWAFEDLYRVPGPIQFEGEVSDLVCFTVQLPTVDDLTWGKGPKTSQLAGRSTVPKYAGTLSELQTERLKYRPPLPPICTEFKARCRRGNQYPVKDPFTQRQIAFNYPRLSNANLYHLQEVINDKYTPPIGAGLRVGLAFISRQSPGIMNVLWGLHNRLKMVNGVCYAFYGLAGLLEGKYIELSDDDLTLFMNQGGVELVGRSTSHSLTTVEHQEMARQTCIRLRLDGLVIPGSSFAMSEAALLSEYFLAHHCPTSVVGVPATGSNNVCHDLIETCIGFDSSTKVYASLIGNVLTDAASMPKYWHFVRLMGRQPSHEVLECALQCHPNFVIIAEEYGAADKTLLHVVHDIADVVCLRAEMGKNFGTVLIPDALLMHLPNMKILCAELGALLREAQTSNEIKRAQSELTDVGVLTANGWLSRLTPWSLALFSTFPKFIRRELLQIDMGEMRFERLETEQLLAQMVKKELDQRALDGRYTGKFQAVTHFFGYQGRSSMPSQFDSNLAFAHGHVASIVVESGLTGYCTTIRGLCGDVIDWKCGAIPFTVLMKLVPSVERHTGWNDNRANIPIIPSAEVTMDSKAYRWMKAALEQWSLQDRFCNPGPIQYHGIASTFYNRVLFEEQAEYYDMIRRVECYTNLLRDSCRFGVSKEFLKNTFIALNGLLMLAYHPDDLICRMPNLASLEQYEAWEQQAGRRPKVWKDFAQKSLTRIMPNTNFAAARSFAYGDSAADPLSVAAGFASPKAQEAFMQNRGFAAVPRSASLIASSKRLEDF